MKIRIITHHAVHNHGAVLQLYALSKVLSKYDKTVCALDYKKNYDFMDEHADRKYNISLKSIPYYLQYLAEKGLGRTWFNVNKRRILEEFKQENKLVGGYYSYEQDLDAVFIGSDEVFSIEPGLNPFFWGMGVPSKYAFAYAGCFGPTDMDFIKEKKAENYIKAGINTLDGITVRDKNSHDIIKELSGASVEQVCDPVILYDFEEEKKLFNKMTTQKYLLVYAYDERMNDEEEWKHIKSYASKNDLKIYTVGFYHKWCDKSINATPLELLQWIRGAECVVTDTFHGTVMSMVMNVPFATKIRGNRHKLGYLLEEYNLLDREIVDFANLSEIFEKQIDYTAINAVIRQKREQGLAFIDSCITKVQG